MSALAEQQARTFLTDLQAGNPPQGTVADTANVTENYAFSDNVAWAVIPVSNQPLLNAVLGMMGACDASEPTPATITRGENGDGRESIDIAGKKGFAVEMVATPELSGPDMATANFAVNGVLFMINKEFLGDILAPRGMGLAV